MLNVWIKIKICIVYLIIQSKKSKFIYKADI